MSLNRSEQRLFDYLQKHQDERQFWQGKFHHEMKDNGDERVTVDVLQRELWRYYLERGEVVPDLKEALMHEGRQRTSMKNLAELLLRLWVAPRPKPKKPPGE